MTSSNKLLRELLFWICKRNNSSLIGQCAGHVTRFLKSYDFTLLNQRWKKESNNSCVLESRINFWKMEHFCMSKQGKVKDYPKLYIPSTYSKHWLYTVAYTIDCVCSKMLNHGLNHGLFLSLFKLIPCPIHWIVYVLAYLNFIFEF